MRVPLREAFLLAAAVGLTSCGGGDLVLPGDVGPPADLVVVSGDDQSASPGTQLADPLLVRVVDAQGAGVPEAPVSWVIGEGGGSVTPGSTETSAEGLAQTRWTLGPAPGLNTVSAVVSGVAVVSFSASATGGGGGGGGGGGDGGGSRADHLVFLVEPTDTEEDQRMVPWPTVAVMDDAGRVIADVRYEVELELVGGEGEGAKLDGKRRIETRAGLAVFDDLKVKDPGSYVLRAHLPDEASVGAVDSRAFEVHED